MKKTMTRFLQAGGLGAALALLATPGLAAHTGGDVPLRDPAGLVISTANGNLGQPYSPKQTCGGCHDYDTITQGYHFQQGFNELIADAERTAGEKPFIKSPGMYGKW
ncbi:MAG: hypothetical protein P1P84_20720 [Deferrisomatales bacterium]|nr:hypothetical protein [Deferrisomatales bacterium]